MQSRSSSDVRQQALPHSPAHDLRAISGTAAAAAITAAGALQRHSLIGASTLPQY